MPYLLSFLFYHGGQSTFPVISFISTFHNILPKFLAGFQYNQCKNIDSSDRGLNPVVMTIQIKTRGPWWHCIAPLADTWNPFITNITIRGNWFNPLPHNPDFLLPAEKSLLKTLWEKEKMLVTSIFSFTHNVFYPSQNKFQFFIYIYFVICKSFQFGQVPFSVVW